MQRRPPLLILHPALDANVLDEPANERIVVLEDGVDQAEREGETLLDLGFGCAGGEVDRYGWHGGRGLVEREGEEARLARRG